MIRKIIVASAFAKQIKSKNRKDAYTHKRKTETVAFLLVVWIPVTPKHRGWMVKRLY